MRTTIRKYLIPAFLLISGLGISQSSVFAENADSLNFYLKVAAGNNPEVKSSFHSYKAALERVPQAGAYQDPELEMGFFLEPMDIVGGRQVAQFKLMQMFPWFGTKKSAQTEATHRAKMAYEQFRETRNNVYLNVYTQWYLLLNLKQQLINNRENKRMLKQLEELAIQRFSSPTVSSSSSYSIPAPTALKQGVSGMSTQIGASGGSMPSSGSSTSSMGGMSGMGNSGAASSMGGGSASAGNIVGSSGVGSNAGMGGMSGMGSSSSGMNVTYESAKQTMVTAISPVSCGQMTSRLCPNGRGLGIAPSTCSDTKGARLRMLGINSTEVA